MFAAFFLFFGIGCMLGLAYALVRYIIPAFIVGFASLGPGIKGIIEASKEGARRGWERGWQRGKPDPGPGPAKQ